MANSYDIFISYRRKGGFDTAKHLYDLLTRDGYTVSFDIDTLRKGKFDETLINRIDECKDFILIIDSNTFNRILDPDFDPRNDWLRQELSYALKKEKNIIPIFLEGVHEFPKNLPQDVAGVALWNGPEYNRYYFNDFYKTIKDKFLISKPRKPIKSYIYICLSILIIALLIIFFVNFFNSPKPNDNPIIQEENTEKLTSSTKTQETTSSKKVSIDKVERRLKLTSKDGIHGHLNSQGNQHYDGSNITDGNLGSAWIVNLPHINYENFFVEGPIITVEDEFDKITQIIVYNGYQKEKQNFYDNTRASWMMIYRDNGNGIEHPDSSDILFEGTLIDKMGSQQLSVNPRFDFSKKGSKFKLRFSDKNTHPYFSGKKYNDFAITEIEMIGV